ncbi:MAG: helix-turn-helix transcriptional regulator [Thiotrichales bacterium]|nr:MAG: helix-turn-helix transcriptional regulator [Thiotrichales bacterium]
MTIPTNIQILKQNGVPAFVVMDYKDYHELRMKNDEGKRTTYPHAVVEMMFMQGMSHLKAWRTYLSLTQAELAKKVGATQAQINNYENGKSIPRADMLMRLSSAMGVSADLLWEDDREDD